MAETPPRPDRLDEVLKEMEEYSTEGTIGTHTVRGRIAHWAERLRAVGPRKERHEEITDGCGRATSDETAPTMAAPRCQPTEGVDASDSRTSVLLRVASAVGPCPEVETLIEKWEDEDNDPHPSNDEHEDGYFSVREIRKMRTEELKAAFRAVGVPADSTKDTK